MSYYNRPSGSRYNFRNTGGRYQQYKAPTPTNVPKKRLPDSMLSDQQRATINEIVGGTTHLQIAALAGCAKTSTGAESCFRMSAALRKAFLAFGVSISEDNKTKLPDDVMSATFHKVGRAAVIDRFGYQKVEKDKVWHLLPENLPPSTKVVVKKLVGLCKNTLTDPNDREAMLDLCDRFDVDLYGENGGNYADTERTVFGLTAEIIEACKVPNGTIDFDDMIWLVVIHALPLPKLDILFVDEAQDLNPARQQMVMLFAQAGTRVVYIGDHNQAIYGFTGADTKSMVTMHNLLAATKRSIQTLPLTITRRCPKKVVLLARELVPDFDCPDDAKPGHVCRGDATIVIDDWATRKWHWEPLAEPCTLNNETFNKGEMVLCRTNAPLVQMAYACIRRGVPCKIQGRDIGEGLTSLIQRLVPDTATVPSLLSKLVEYQDKESAKIRAANEKSPSRAESQLSALQDKIDCIEALTEGQDTVGQVLARITFLFQDVLSSDADRHNYVLFSSCHKAKGMESENIRIVHPELMPHPMAKTKEAQEQEHHLKYVAETRSLDTLHIHN